MKVRFNLSVVALCAVALLLAACNQPTTKAPPAGFITLSMKLDGATIRTPDAMRPQGIPNDPVTGDLALDSVRVTVRDKNGDTVLFTEDAGTFVAAEAGADHLTLDANGSAEVSLPSHLEPYTFESFAEANGAPVAYHSVEQRITVSSSVTIRLKSLLGDAIVAPRYPTNYAVPGEIIDLMLVVMANGNDDYPADYLQVPFGDFTVDYDTIMGGTIVSSSNRGIRVLADAFCTSVEVDGTVTGLRLVGDTVSERAAPFALHQPLACTPAVDGSLAADVEAPTVTLDYNVATRRASGTADDNTAIAKLEIYDGPVLVATTDETAVGASVSQIAFLAGSTAYQTTLKVDPTGGLRAVAYDHAGNAGVSEETERPEIIEVDEGGSIQAALDQVAEGGTVYLPAGTFDGDLEVTGSVTIVGDPSGGTVITPAGITGFSLYSTDTRKGKAILEVTGEGTVVEIRNVTVQGMGGTKCDDYFAGIRVSNGATLHLSDSAVTDLFDDYASCGVGIMVGRNYNGEHFSATAYLNNVEVTNFGKGAIVIEHPDTRAYINGGRIIGLGQTSKGAQNGVQVSRGASAEVRGMTIEDILFVRDGAIDTAAGILLYEPGTHVVLENNTLRNNGNGITILRQAAGGTLQVTGNTLEDNLTHVENANPAELDLSRNTFDGVTPSAATALELQAIEDAIVHSLDHHESTDKWWQPQPEDYGLARVVPGHLYVTEASGSIQRAIDAAKPGDIINILDAGGDFAAEGTLRIDVPFLTIKGNGATARNAQITAEGVTLDSLNFEHDSHALVIIDATNVTLTDVNIKTPAMGIRFLNPDGNADYSGFTMTGGSITGANIGISLEHAAGYQGSAGYANEPIRFGDVDLTGVSFSDITFKGVYLEALSNATLKGLTFDNVGNIGYSDSSNPGAWGSAIDINLKYSDYANLTLHDVTVTDSGYSSGHETGAGVTIKARDDASSYHTVPASLDNVVIDGLTVEFVDVPATHAALRIGEFGKTNAGPSRVVVTNSHLEGVYALMNWTEAPVDASDPSNALHGMIYTGSDPV